MSKDKEIKVSFFSAAFDLLLVEENLPYDLYINSSSNIKKEKFVRIFPQDGRLTKDDIATFRKKYHQLYIKESHRNLYLKSLVKSDTLTDSIKTEVIKDSAIQYLNKIFDEDKELTTEILGEAISGCRDSVELMIDVIGDYDIKNVQDLIGSLSFHDFYTYDHSINVSMYCIALYKSLKPSAKKYELVMAGLGGLLHDLGKIKIPTRIINNPGKLDDADFKEIKNHPHYGLELLSDQVVQECGCGHEVDFNIIRRVINEHHENYNGTGYPGNIEGKDIHVMARVTAIADFFDAITTKRSYHEVLSTEDALEIMARSVGRKIDPKIFEIFTKNVNLVLTGNVKQQLPDDFDACRPHNVLPLKDIGPEVTQKNFFKKEESSYGKVKSDIFVDNDKKDGKKKVA